MRGPCRRIMHPKPVLAHKQLNTFAPFSFAVYSERPTSVNAYLGMVAVFRCISITGNLDVTWRVNGSFVNSLQANSTISDVTTTTNGSCNSLSIRASENCNNTVIECVITNLQDGKVGYSGATLTIQGCFFL